MVQIQLPCLSARIGKNFSAEHNKLASTLGFNYLQFNTMRQNILSISVLVLFIGLFFNAPARAEWEQKFFASSAFHQFEILTYSQNQADQALLEQELSEAKLSLGELVKQVNDLVLKKYAATESPAELPAKLNIRLVIHPYHREKKNLFLKIEPATGGELEFRLQENYPTSKALGLIGAALEDGDVLKSSGTLRTALIRLASELRSRAVRAVTSEETRRLILLASTISSLDKPSMLQILRPRVWLADLFLTYHTVRTRYSCSKLLE